MSPPSRTRARVASRAWSSSARPSPVGAESSLANGAERAPTKEAARALARGAVARAAGAAGCTALLLALATASCVDRRGDGAPAAEPGAMARATAARALAVDAGGGRGDAGRGGEGAGGASAAGGAGGARTLDGGAPTDDAGGLAAGAPDGDAGASAPAAPGADAGTPDAGADPADAGAVPTDAGADAPPAPPAPRVVLVPAGPYWSGCAPGDTACGDDEPRGHEATLAAFALDAHEVTVSEYDACVTRGACADDDLTGYAWPGQPFTVSDRCNWMQAGRGDHPLNCVSWVQADAYCRAQGKQLPTEAQWEKAARGGDRRLYAWGEGAPSCERAVWGDGAGRDGCGRGATWPVRSLPAEGYGAFDLAGNVSEWVADTYVERAAGGGPAAAPAERRRVYRGGAWNTDRPAWLRVSARFASVELERRAALGFRCAGPPTLVPAPSAVPAAAPASSDAPPASPAPAPAPPSAAPSR